MIDIKVHVLVSHLDAANSNLTVFGFLQLIVFWTITTFLLLILAKTLPEDQDAMDAELARYAESKISADQGEHANLLNDDSHFFDDDATL